MASTGLRVTGHNGRFGSAKHNGRDFDLSKADHIDPKRTAQNFYWTWNGGSKGVTPEQFTACEQAYYERVFQEGLDEQNEVHRSKRQYKRVREMKDWMKAYQHRPEERILQVGSMANPVSPQVSQAIVLEYLQWEMDWSNQHGRPFQILDFSAHKDETSLHGHERRVWQYADEKGVWRVGQNKALEAAGVPLPDPTQPEGPKNNRKMTFDAMCRERLIDICYAHGVQVERDALPWPSGHVSKSEYIANQEMAKEQAQKAAELDKKAAELKQKAAELDQKAAEQAQKAAEQTQKAAELQERADMLDRRKSALDARESRLGRLEKVQRMTTPAGRKLPDMPDLER